MSLFGFFFGFGAVSSVTIMNCIPIDALTLQDQPLNEFYAWTTRQVCLIIYFCFAILKRKTSNNKRRLSLYNVAHVWHLG